MKVNKIDLERNKKSHKISMKVQNGPIYGSEYSTGILAIFLKIESYKIMLTIFNGKYKYIVDTINYLKNSVISESSNNRKMLASRHPVLDSGSYLSQLELLILSSTTILCNPL